MIVLHPEWFPWVFLPAALALAASTLERRARVRALAAYVVPERLAELGIGREVTVGLRGTLRFVALVLLGMALAGPLYGEKEMTTHPEGADLVIALDVSRSMAVTDVKPSRLDRAVHRIGQLLDQVAGNRVALVLFSGDAWLAVPLTLDHGAVRLFLEAAEPGMVPAPGSSLEAAVKAAAQALGPPGGTGRGLVIVSDGEATLGDARAAVEVARKAGITVWPVAVGTLEGGPVPVTDAVGNFTGYRRGADGQLVISRLETVAMSQLATASGGTLYAERVGADLATRLAGEVQRLARGELEGSSATLLENRYQWLAGAALLLLVLEWLVPVWRAPAREVGA